MTVRVQSPVVAQRQGAPTTFTDPFTGTTADELRRRYAEVNHGTAPLFSQAGGNLVYTSSPSSGGEGIICFGAPGLAVSQSQFIIVTIAALNAANRTGVGLYLSGAAQAHVSAGQMYGYHTHFFTGTINAFGLTPGDPNAYALGLALGAPAVNDVMEFQVDIRAADNRIRLWQNNTLLLDVTDNIAARVTSANRGMPGFFGSGNGGGSISYSTMTIRPSR